MFKLQDKNEVLTFLNTNSGFANAFLGASAYPHDSLLASQLLKLVSDPHIDTLYQQTVKEYGDFEDVEQAFEEAFKNVKYHFNSFEAPKIQTAITGLSSDLYVSDSLIIIGLDYFLGDEARFKPDLPQYMLRRYNKDYLIPSTLLLLSKQYNVTNLQQNSMLTDMIYYGKAYYFVEKMLPCAADSLIIGYTAEEVEGAYFNAGTVWSHFIENELLYETSPFIKTKYLEERPKTPEISNKAPGRIGVWLGLQIVRSYMKENPEVTMPQLMQDTDVQKIFTRSKYKPTDQ